MRKFHSLQTWQAVRDGEVGAWECVEVQSMRSIHLDLAVLWLGDEVGGEF